MATDEGGFGDIFDLTFTKFVTPTVIRVLFILVIVFSALWWLFLVIAGFSSSAGGGLTALILGGLGFIIFVLLYRVFFELVMVIFRIKDNTDRAADALDRGAMLSGLPGTYQRVTIPGLPGFGFEAAIAPDRPSSRSPTSA